MHKCGLCNYPDGNHSEECDITRKQKLLESRGINWTGECPEGVGPYLCDLRPIHTSCPECWVKALKL